MHAYSPRPEITFSSFINFGMIKVGVEHTQQIVFRNQGKSTGRVEIRNDNIKDFKIEPSYFKLSPEAMEIVMLSYK